VIGHKSVLSTEIIQLRKLNMFEQNANPPEIRIVAPELKDFEKVFQVKCAKWRENGNPLVFYETDYGKEAVTPESFQELTPLSHDGVRIGVGGEVVVAGSFCFTVAGYYQADGEDIVVLEKYGATHASKISDHTPLTEMNKENEAVDKITDDFEKDWCGCEIRDSGAFICDEHLPVYSILSSGDDKPTIEHFNFDTLHSSDTVKKLMKNQSRIVEALADAGLINLDNQE